MTFPAVALDTRVELKLGSTWTDVTGFCDGGPAQIHRGHPDESTTTQASSMTVPLRNDGARFSALNPTGPYYGQLGRNTPVRVSIPSSMAGMPSYLRLETDTSSFASAPDAAPLQITSGILSVRVDCKITDWTGNHVLIAKAGATAQSWAMWTNGDGRLTFFVFDGSSNHFNFTPLPLPYFGSRIAIRADYNIAAQTVTWYTAPSMSGSWTQISNVNGNWAAGGAPSSISAGTGQAVQVGIGTTSLPGMYGEVYEAQIWHTPAVSRGQASTLVSATNAGTTTWGTNPAAGQKVIVTLAVSNTQTVTSVKDNGTVQSTFTQAAQESANAQLAQIWYADGISLPSAGSYAVTATTSGGKEVTLSGIAYSGVAAGAATQTAVGTNAGSNAPTAGPVTPAGQGALFYTAFGDGSGATETITAPAGFTAQQSANLGASQHCAATADLIDPAGPNTNTPAWGLSDAPAWAAVTAVWDTQAAVLVADPVFTSQTPGAGSFSDAQSNTWTLSGTAELSGRLYRFHGEIPEWPQAWSPVSANVYVTATAAGLLRRLGRTRKPADSALKRAYKRIPSSARLAAYWPAEDMASATQIGQAAGIFAMTSVGLTMASFTGFACSAPLPVMNGASATAIVDPASVTWTDNVVRFLLAIPLADDTNNSVICQVTTQGTIALLQLVYTTGSNLTLNAYNAAGVLQFTNTTHFVNNPLVGRQVRVSVELLGSGNYNVWVLPPGGSATGFGSTWSGTIGGVTSVSFGGGLLTSAMGHFSVQGVSDAINNLSRPLNAWFGETAGARFARLCGEEGVTCRIIGPPDTSQPMGNQTQQTLAALVQECADADRGAWTETRQVVGWGYRTLRSLYNQPVGVPLSYSQNMLGYPLEETEDDQIINNDVAVTNASGSSSRTTLAAGPLSTAAPSLGGAGLYDTTGSVNIASDALLIHQSGWSLHLGTVNEPRYPAVNLDLTETGPLAALLPQILLADLGDRFQIATPPGWLPPMPVDGLIQDWAETLDTRQLDIAWAAVPASPYNVAILNDPVFGHLDTAGSQLNTGVNTSATSWSVATTAGPLWTTNAGDFPFDWKIAGEQVTVTNITGASSPQTATVTRSINGVVKAHLAGEAISLYHPMILAL